MSSLLMSDSPVLTKVRNNKSKRVLQVLQVSATDKDLLVSPNLMSGNGKKSALSQKKTEASQDVKENTPVLPRRSKRKTAAAPKQFKKLMPVESTETNETVNKVSVTKSKKTATRKNKKQSSVDLKQSTIDTFIASSSTNTILESNFKNDATIDNDMQLQKSEHTVESVSSPNYITHSYSQLQDSKDSGFAVTPGMLTSDKPSEKYWELLAEERRKALEEALRENEELHDQLQVLEAENSQLKGCLKEAEKLALLLRQALD